jgi:ribosomal protein L29
MSLAKKIKKILGECDAEDLNKIADDLQAAALELRQMAEQAQSRQPETFAEIWRKNFTRN